MRSHRKVVIRIGMTLPPGTTAEPVDSHQFGPKHPAHTRSEFFNNGIFSRCLHDRRITPCNENRNPRSGGKASVTQAGWPPEGRSRRGGTIPALQNAKPDEL